MTDEATPPIVVANTAPPAMVMTATQYLLTAVGTYLLVDKGMLDNAGLQTLVGALLALVPGVYGVIKTRISQRKQKAMAVRLPDSVAIVK